MLSEPSSTRGLPPLIVLHHIIVRAPSSLPLPHALHGWSEAEYVLWVDEHSEGEALTLVEGVLTHWEKTSGSEANLNSKPKPKEGEDVREYVEAARAVLARSLPR